MKLSENFSLRELCFSPTALRFGIKNTPNEEQLNNLKNLVTFVLQPLRTYFNSPVIVTSGFRSEKLNALVGGKPTSQHQKGQAADIEVLNVPNGQVWRYIKDNLPYDQVILEHVKKNDPYSGWVHVSYNEPQRKQALSCVSMGQYLNGEHYVG